MTNHSATKIQLFSLLEQKEEASTKFDATKATWRILSDKVFAETDAAKIEILSDKETAARAKWDAAAQELDVLNQKVLAFRKAFGIAKFHNWQDEFYTERQIDRLQNLRLVPAQEKSN